MGPIDLQTSCFIDLIASRFHHATRAETILSCPEQLEIAVEPTGSPGFRSFVIAILSLPILGMNPICAHQSTSATALALIRTNDFDEAKSQADQIGIVPSVLLV